jgi:hypothetical protein
MPDMVYKKPSNFNLYALLIIGALGITLLLWGIKIMNDDWREYCENDLGGRLTSSQRLCLDDNGRILDARG